MVRISAVTGGNDISNIEEEAGRLLDIQKASKAPDSKNLLMKLMSLVSMSRTHIVPEEKQKQNTSIHIPKTLADIAAEMMAQKNYENARQRAHDQLMEHLTQDNLRYLLRMFPHFNALERARKESIFLTTGLELT